MNKLKADYIWVMLGTILFRVFCLSVSRLKPYKTIILPIILYECETFSH
jgi:hypothetical protein